MSNVTIPIFNALIAFSILVQAQPRQIPLASLPSSDEVRQWWEQVRAAGAEAAKAADQKKEMLKKKQVGRVYVPHVPDDEDELLSKNDREKMNAEIARTTGNYLGLLREGKEKGYRVPLPDNRLIFIEDRDRKGWHRSLFALKPAISALQTAMLTGSQCSKNSSEWQCPFASCIHSAEGTPLVDAKKLEELATAELKARESRKE